MSKSQLIRMLTRLCMLTVLSASLWQLSGRANYVRTQNSSTPQNPILITTAQLPSADGVVPIELQCQTEDYPKPTKGKALRCVLKNNTSNPISAVSLTYSMEFEGNGQKSTDGGSVTMDALIHHDFRDSNFSKFILPGAERAIVSRRLIEEPMSDIKIVVGIDYVEFDNGMTLGPDSNGSRLVNQIREGAAKYKEWLKGNYLARGKSMAAVKSLLEQTTSVATDLGIDGELEVGAEAYRRNAREVIKFRGGPSEVEKHLVADGSSRNHDR
jgi:hypothetical protein